MATNRLRFLRNYGLPDKSYGIPQLSDITGVPESILNQVRDRGFGAYKSNPQSVRLKGTFTKGVNAPMSAKLSPQQWAMGRVYSYLMGSKKHDQDLRLAGSFGQKRRRGF